MGLWKIVLAHWSPCHLVVGESYAGFWSEELHTIFLFNDIWTVAVVFAFRPALGLRDRIESVRLHRLWWVLLLLCWGFRCFQLSHDIGLGSVRWLNKDWDVFPDRCRIVVPVGW